MRAADRETRAARGRLGLVDHDLRDQLAHAAMLLRGALRVVGCGVAAARRARRRSSVRRHSPAPRRPRGHGVSARGRAVGRCAVQEQRSAPADRQAAGATRNQLHAFAAYQVDEEACAHSASTRPTSMPVATVSRKRLPSISGRSPSMGALRLAGVGGELSSDGCRGSGSSRLDMIASPDCPARASLPDRNRAVGGWVAAAPGRDRPGRVPQARVSVRRRPWPYRALPSTRSISDS